MVVAGFDGRNATVIVDGVEFKAMMILFDKVSPLQTKFVSESLKFAGFDVSQRDVQGMFVSASAITKRLTDLIDVSKEITEEVEEKEAAVTVQ